MPTVEEDDTSGTVSIDGREITGFVDHQLCASCGAPRVYYGAFDAYFCAVCNVWLETACADPSCTNCRSRPVAPLPIDGPTR